MIKNLEIKNFKSIKHLELDCKKINLFIGEPNTGKSNILEALGILSFEPNIELGNIVRFERMSNLFYDENLDDEIKIRADEGIFEIRFEVGSFKGDYQENGPRSSNFRYGYDGSGSTGSSGVPSPIKFYKFTVRLDYPRNESDFLLPPFGDNLLSVLMSHKDLKNMVARIFEPYGIRIVFRPQEGKIDILKFQEDVFISYPYSLASDTLQRIIFYLTAIGSNKNSVLIFEEPESNSFPYHTKHLGERIAFDETNQYFIATHNPYLLLSILEKSRKGEVAVFITYFEDYQTKVKCLTDEQLSELMDGGYDPFFNLDSFIEEE
jgi:AAA15 family ATPase/GTPase